MQVAVSATDTVTITNTAPDPVALAIALVNIGNIMANTFKVKTKASVNHSALDTIYTVQAQVQLY